MRGCVTDTGALYVVWRARYDCDRVKESQWEKRCIWEEKSKRYYTRGVHTGILQLTYFHSQPPEGKGVKVSSGQTEEQHACFS